MDTNPTVQHLTNFAILSVTALMIIIGSSRQALGESTHRGERAETRWSAQSVFDEVDFCPMMDCAPEPERAGPTIRFGQVSDPDPCLMPCDYIRRYIALHPSSFRVCYERTLITDNELSGRITVRFIIESTGTVSSVTIEESTINSDQLHQCITDVFWTIEFPWRPPGCRALIHYPLLFTPNRS